MLYHIHQTHHKVADFKIIFDDFKKSLTNSNDGIHLYPELYLTGYPLQDLCLQRSFIESYKAQLDELNAFAQEQNFPGMHLVGGLHYELEADGTPRLIKNVIYKVESNTKLQIVCVKRLLPNYDIFDEQKYFTPGESSSVLNYQGLRLGLLICEDMWSSSFHKVDPVGDLFNENLEKGLDVIINLSASPFHLNKEVYRHKRAQEIAHLFKCPFIYCNRVGGEDEILFDGDSFVMDSEDSASEKFNLRLRCKKWIKDYQVIELEKKSEKVLSHDRGNTIKKILKPNTWEGLFKAQIHKETLRLETLSNQECFEIISALTFGLQEYASKSSFSKFTIALSGGIDSSLVLTLIALSLKDGQSLEAVYMPSIHSSSLSYQLSSQLCKNLNIPLRSLPIKFLHSSVKNLFESTYKEKFEGITDENIQSRLRGALLYTRSNQIGSMVVNTSNKSEIAVGYSTQYGDSVGAISLLGDVFKSQVFCLARYINKKYSGLIPEDIITRPPSAELRPGQVDTESLPNYEILDTILEGILSYRYDKKSLINLGIPSEEIDKVFDLYRRSEYKRKQFCPIIKVGAKSFGFGYRVPLSHSTSFYKS